MTDELEVDGIHNDNTNTGLSERFVKFIFGLLGIGVLLPWNAFVSAKPYFQARLCSEASGMSANIELWFGFIYNLSSVLSLAFIIGLQWWKDRAKLQAALRYEVTGASEALETSIPTQAEDGDTSKDRNWYMIVIPLSLYLVVFFFTTILVLFPSVPTMFFLVFTFVGLAVCGVCTAFASAGIVGTAGMFPSSIGINPYFSGQAVGGVAVSCANFVAAAMEDPQPFRDTYCQQERQERVTADTSVNTCVPYHDIDWASFSYFLLGSLVLGACIIGYSYIDTYQIKTTTARSSYESLAEADTTSSQVNYDTRESERGNIELHSHQDETSGLDGVAIAKDASKEWDSSESLEFPPNNTSVSSVFHAVRAPAFSIYFIFFVTLSLFPGWTSQLKSVYECTSRVRLANDLYTPLTFVVFNAADLTGRVLSGRVPLERIHDVSSKLVALSLSRLAFFPLFLICVARDSAHVKAAIQSDLFSLLVQVTFGVGNGMITTLSFMHAPTLLPAIPQTQTRASEILNLALSFGLLCGSIFSFPFSRIATGHW